MPIRLLLAAALLQFSALAGAASTPVSPATDKRIALTYDDVPREPGAFFTSDERTRRLLAQFRKAQVRQAAFFITVGNLEEPHGAGGERRIRRYAAAGHAIANHSFAHEHLTKLSAEEYLADIDKAETWLRGRKGHRAWFRFPFLNEGRRDKDKRDAVRAGLKARGLANAYVTVDASDWNMETRTAEAVKAGKRVDMAALRDLYVESHVEAAQFNDDLARRTLGRSPAHVLLLHETDLAALFTADLVAALRRAGWRIISADEAFADPIAAAEPDVPSAQGTLTEALAWEKGLPAPRWYSRNDTKLADALFFERVLKEDPPR